MKAMILAAGLGSRLGELTKNRAKCLIDINGKPMVRHVSEKLHRAGVREVIINLFYLPESVQAYCTVNLKDLFNKIEFSREPELFGTGGGLKAAQSFFTGQPFFYLVNADIYTSFDLRNLDKEIKTNPKLLGALAVMNRQDVSYLEFDEKNIFYGANKSQTVSQPNMQLKGFCGLQILSSRIFDYLSLNKAKSFSIIESYCQAKEHGEQLLAVDIADSAWFDMGTPQKLEELRQYLADPP